VGGRHGRDAKSPRVDRRSVVDAEQPRGRHAEPVSREVAVRLAEDDCDVGVRFDHRQQRFGVQMVGVVVARRDGVDRRQPLGRDDAFRHPHVRPVAAGVLPGQRVG
jgi:hypothetical protein